MSGLGDDQIRQLRTEAAAAGDDAQVRLCDAALVGDPAALAACVAAADSARAAEDKPRIFRTEDGYTFYEQPDGTLTDTRDPDSSDLTFDSLAALKREVGVTEIQG